MGAVKSSSSLERQQYKVQPTIPTPWTTPYSEFFRWIFDLANSVKIRFSLRILMSSLKFNGRFCGDAAAKPRSA